jgi:hypothetical protein
MPGGISNISSPVKDIRSGMEAVADNIFRVAGDIGSAAIDHAIHSFTSGWSDAASPNWSELPEGSAVQIEGFIESPHNYFKHAFETSPAMLDKCSSMFPMQEVLSHLRNPGFDFHSGLSAFMKCGMKEALGGLKVETRALPNPAPDPLPLNELLIPEKLKTVDPSVLQSSLSVAKKMFSVLDKLLGEGASLDLSKLRHIRC